MYCYSIEKSEIQKRKKKQRSGNKYGSHFESFVGCPQVFVLWGLAGMLQNCSQLSKKFILLVHTHRVDVCALYIYIMC